VAFSQHTDFAPSSRAESSGSNSWLVVWTRPNMEAVARKELENQGFPVFLPMLTRRLPNRHTRTEPLFGRYLFSAPRDDGFWSAMRGTRGVADVLRDPTGQPYWLSPGAISGLMARVVTDEPRIPSLAIGTVVRALSGVFQGFTGTVILDSGERVHLLHSLFGRPARQWYSPEDVEAA
jgi:transcriptional antiterminator RfaH